MELLPPVARLVDRVSTRPRLHVV